MKSYYYWLSKIRKLAIESIPKKPSALSTMPSTITRPMPTTFAEIPVERKTLYNADRIMIHIGNAVLEVSVNAPDSLIQSIILAVSKCQVISHGPKRSILPVGIQICASLSMGWLLLLSGTSNEIPFQTVFSFSADANAAA